MKKLLKDVNRFFFFSALPVVVGFFIIIIPVSLFKSVVRFPELMVRNGGPEEIKKK